MHIEKLQICGFKSFAKKTVFTFDRGITAVVGPNGSGKSNVADALRWVFGEQSMKHIRGKKAEDVIFSGSSGKSKLHFAEVRITLNNEDHSMPIDFDHVEIARRLYRSGESEYVINKAKVRLVDILSLLAKAGFAGRSYGVVGQGMIGSLITSGPKERLELFEDASGVTQYKIKRDQALRKLESTLQNMQQTHQLVAELEPHVSSLKRQADKARQRETVQDELREALESYYRTTWSTLSLQEFEQQALQKQAEKRMKRFRDSLTEFGVRLAEASSFETEYHTKSDQYQEKLREIREHMHQFEGEIARIDGSLAASKETSVDSKAQMLERDHTELDALIGKLYAEHDALKQEIAGHTTQFAEQRHLLDLTSKEHDALREEVDRLQEIQPDSLSPEDFSSRLGIIQDRHHALVGALRSCRSVQHLTPVYQSAVRVGRDISSLLRFLEGDRSLVDSGKLRELGSHLDELVVRRDQAKERIQQLQILLATRGTKRDVVADRLRSETKRHDDVVRQLLQIRSSADSGENVQLTAMREQKATLERSLAFTKRHEGRMVSMIEALRASYEKQRASVNAMQREQRTIQDQLDQATTRFHSFDVEISRIVYKKGELEEQMRDQLSERTLNELYQTDSFDWKQQASALTSFQTDELKQRIARLRSKVEHIGGIDPEVISEYESTKQRYDFLSGQLNDLNQASDSLRKAIVSLNKKIDSQFYSSFKKINASFQTYFSALFDGGKASLQLDEGGSSEDMIDSSSQAHVRGVEITATPPGKRLKSVHVLSGGEKTMTSIALLCAIMTVNPSPFVMLDEVDSALDESNTGRFTRILQDMAKITQFIVVTHNRQTMKVASSLYGVTMQRDGVSQLVSVKFDAVASPVVSSSRPKAVAPIQSNQSKPSSRKRKTTQKPVMA
jgi:chromosome segregation protein